MSQNGKIGFGQNINKSHVMFLICWNYFDIVHITVLNMSLALTTHLKMVLEILKSH